MRSRDERALTIPPFAFIALIARRDRSHDPSESSEEILLHLTDSGEKERERERERERETNVVST